ncbi:MAG: DUF418 domain-containing protein [Chitinophagaceae bacterium]|nr:DUF418 domain-containing protein [Chitinophagaceae bacterium]
MSQPTHKKTMLDKRISQIQTGRIEIIDTVRGVALLGILLININFFALPFYMGSNLNVRNEYSGVNYNIIWIMNLGFEGTMRALFSLLFGASSILLLTKLEKKSSGLSPADVYYRRLIWLMIFGIIDAYILLWTGDILFQYAICGLFLFPFRKMKPKYLLILGIVIMLIYNFKATLDMYEARDTRLHGETALALEKQNVKLTKEQEAAKKNWNEYNEDHKIENIRIKSDNLVKDFRKGYLSIWQTVKPWNEHFETIEFYKDIFWNNMSLFFIGMALFGWGVLTGKRSNTFYWAMILTGYILGFFLSYISFYSRVKSGFDLSLITYYLPVDVYPEKCLLIALGHLGVVMLSYKYKVGSWLLNALAKVGQMAFTNYLSQSIICGFIFYGVGLGWFGALERYQIYYVVFGIWIFQIIFSNIWSLHYRFGPLEWVWRSLTYGKSSQ